MERTFIIRPKGTQIKALAAKEKESRQYGKSRFDFVLADKKQMVGVGV